MKDTHFYSFLIEKTEITLELADLDLTKQERVHLISLIDANIHSSVIKLVLDNLDKENKKIFVKNLSENNHEKIWTHLRNNLEDIEGSIRQIILETIKELREDIKRTKNQDIK